MFFYQQVWTDFGQRFRGGKFRLLTFMWNFGVDCVAFSNGCFLGIQFYDGGSQTATLLRLAKGP